MDVPKYSAMSPLSGFVGDMEYIALYAGESCTLINEIKPAAEIVRGTWCARPKTFAHS
jgi:nitronate monooxygenase/enoyl-[acyl-carrier protein] reductase II